MLVKVLDDGGFHVDIVTFNEGREREYRNAAVHRINPRWKVTGVRPGFSFKKLYCDVWLLFLSWSMLRRNRYDVVHAVEEAGFIAWFLYKLYRIPYIYDMDSLLSDQLVEKFPRLGIFLKPMQWLEMLPMKSAIAIAPMCEDLAKRARDANASVVVLKDVSLITEQSSSLALEVEDLREVLDIKGPLILYVGNLERYQGLELLIEAMAQVANRRPDAELVVIGGVKHDIERYARYAEKHGANKNIHLVGARPVEYIGAYLCQADILVSPRMKGTNTPMKIYSYLHSAIPIVATNLPTHTQVLNSDIALLTSPDSQSFAQAIEKLIDDQAKRKQIGECAQKYAEKEHSLPSFRHNVHALYDLVHKSLPS